MRKKKLKNYGLIIDTPRPEDYKLGGYTKLGTTVLQPDGQWDDYLPKEEFQNNGLETSACVSFGTLSACEVLVKRLYKEEFNWSDRFLAWNSGTTPAGNSPHTVGEYLRKGGSPLQEKWDFTPDLDTWDEFYATPPAKLLDNAREDFLDKYDFLHEYTGTTEAELKAALKLSPIGVAVTAWTEKNGIYYSPPNMAVNHWCVLYGYDDNLRAWKIFDSYSNVRKLYSYDALIAMPKRYSIKKKGEIEKPVPLLVRLIRYIICLFRG